MRACRRLYQGTLIGRGEAQIACAERRLQVSRAVASGRLPSGAGAGYALVWARLGLRIERLVGGFVLR